MFQIVLRTGVLFLLVVGACFSPPKWQDGKITCSESNPECPPGLQCYSGVCSAEDPGLQDGGIDVMIDAPPPTAMLTIDKTSADLGSVIVGQTSVPATFTITNTGNATSSMPMVTVTGSGYALLAGGCSATLAPSSSCNVQVTLTPTAAGAPMGSVSVSATQGGTVMATLTATALLPGELGMAPLMHDFGTVVQTLTSTTQDFTVTNSGGAATGTVSAVLGGSGASQFEITANTCTSTLAGGGSCIVTVRFKPTSGTVNAQQATLTVSASPGGNAVANLSGTAQAPGNIVVGGSGAFGNLQTGLTSTNTLTVTNTGGQTTTALSITRTGDNQFSILTGMPGDCIDGVTTLSGSASCSIRVQFAPTAPGAVSGSVMVTATTGGSGSATLSGTGLAPGNLTIAPVTHNFGTIVAGQLSGTQDFTVTNTGGTATGTVSVVLGGTAPSQYEITANTCSGTLAGSAMCTVTVRFKPSAGSAGLQQASLTASASPGGSPSSALSGTAQTPAVIAVSGSGAFGNVQTNLTATNSITVTNDGQQSTSALSITRSGDNQFSILTGQAGDCVNGVTVLAGAASCTIRVQFAPTAAGAVSGSVMVSATTGGNQSVALSGTGLAPGSLSIAPSSHNFGTVVAGQVSGTQDFTVSNTGGVATGTVAIALGGSSPSSYQITSNTCSGALAGGAMCTVTVRFTPGVSSSGSLLATLTASASPGGSPSSSLSGTAQVPANIALGGNGAFGDRLVNSTTVQTLTVTNNGQQTTSALTVARTGNAQFSILTGMAGDCVSGVTTLAGSASCNVRVQFAPTASGSVTGLVTVSATTGGSQATALSGNGQTPATLSQNPASNNFMNVEVGQLSSGITYTITNTGDLASTVPVVTPSSEIEVFSNTCTVAIPAGGMCTMTLRFRPSTFGARSATVTVAVTGSSVQHSASATGMWLLSVARSGTSGTITSNVGGINCPGTCSALIANNTNVTLTSTTTNGSGVWFSSWTGAGAPATCNGSPARTCVVPMDASKSLTGNFPAISANLAFITSTTNAMNLGSVAMYDAACNARATAAGINNATNDAFVSYMSSSTSNATTRIGTGSGWRRMDGRVFATSKTNLLTNQAILNPVRFNEMGGDLGDNLIATGSNEDGTHGASCTDWTGTGSFSGGYSMGGPGSWGGNTGVGGCSSSWRVLCLGKTVTTGPSATTFAGKKMWVTNSTHTVGFSPDTACNADKPASAASGKAFLATTTATAGSLLTANQMYVRPDGQEVGTGGEIAAGLNRSGIWQQGNGAYPLSSTAGVSIRVWTGAVDAATLGTTTSTCSNWTNNSGGTGVQQGNLESSRNSFFDLTTNVTCNPTGTAVGRLYCFEP